jgi:hypothetical protein
MKKQTWFTGAVISIITLVGLVIVGLAVSTGNAVNNRMGSVPSINILSAGKGCDKNVVAAQALRNRGFTDAQFVMGEDKINWSAPEANERGDAAFSNETPKTAAAVVEELSSDKPKPKAAREALLKQSGATAEQLQDPNNWVPAQLNTESDWEGNTAYQNGTAVKVATRESASGDVVWLFVNPDVCVQVVNGQAPPEDAVTGHRAGCGNPQLELPKPAKPPVTTTTKPKTPPTTVVTIPPTTVPTTPPTTVPCNKTEKPASTEEYQWEWNQAKCQWEKKANPFYQPPQHNPGQAVGPTPGAPQQPTVPPTGTTPPAGQPAPAPTPGGTDSGSPTQYPGGTTTDPGGTTTGGGPSGPTGGTPPTVDDGTHGGNPGGF